MYTDQALELLARHDAEIYEAPEDAWTAIFERHNEEVCDMHPAVQVAYRHLETIRHIETNLYEVKEFMDAYISKVNIVAREVSGELSH